MKAATFGWLCVETNLTLLLFSHGQAATFGWLCVETRLPVMTIELDLQPPSGGCVLKPLGDRGGHTLVFAATFGWLCVETEKMVPMLSPAHAATFGWLCVETSSNRCKYCKN